MRVEDDSLQSFPLAALSSDIQYGKQQSSPHNFGEISPPASPQFCRGEYFLETGEADIDLSYVLSPRLLFSFKKPMCQSSNFLLSRRKNGEAQPSACLFSQSLSPHWSSPIQY